MCADDDLVIRRTSTGWRVGGEDLPDLTSAMVLADLLVADLPEIERPPCAEAVEDEAGRLRVTVAQLEYALAARVVVEQAIGVLAERHRINPRRAFERLRQAARDRGRRVHELARDVVATTTNPLLPIPLELTRNPPPEGEGRKRC